MKILYVITKSNWGGAQRHVFDLAVEAKKAGFDVVVALGGNGILRQRLAEASVSTISIGSLGRDVSAGKDASSFAEIRKVIRIEKPDILHLHSPKAGGLGALAGRMSRMRLLPTFSKKGNTGNEKEKSTTQKFPKKIIYTAHGWPWNENRPSYQKAAIGFFSWLTMLFCTDIITLSRKETDQALAFPFVKEKIRYIPLGITPPIFYGHVNALDFIEKKIKPSPTGTTTPTPTTGIKFEKRPIVGTISELHPNKGLVYFIEAMREVKKNLPTVAAIIIGEGEQRALLESLIKKYELTDTVYLAGYIDQASQYLKAFNVFSLTSLKEGLPYAIFEAAYAGVPVVATAVGGIPELVKDMTSGILIQPKKPAEIAYALSFLLNPEHKAEQRAYAEALRKHIEEEFPIRKMFERTFEVYRE